MNIVLKYGGNAMDDSLSADPLLDEIATRVAAGDRIVLIHGGGPQVDAALDERGIFGKRIHGLRVTDAATLAVAEAVLCGTVNKSLVRALRVRGVNAVGISGQDGGLLSARRSPPIDGESLGFVGQISKTEPAVLTALLLAGFLPVVAPIAIEECAATALNVNADTAAGAIAGALAVDAYIVVTNVDRVRLVEGDPATGMAHLSTTEVLGFLQNGTFGGGMRPKMESVVQALSGGARKAVIIGRAAGSLSGAFSGNGTTIVNG